MSRSWRQILQRTVEVLRTEGPRSLWFKILGETVYRRALLVECYLDTVPPERIQAREPVVFDRLQEAEVDEYVALRPKTDRAEVRRRLAAGQWCFTGRYEGRLVHVCWVARDRAWIDYLHREIRLAPDEAYLYQAFTAPDMRGQNISPARGRYVQHTLREMGYRRLLAVIMPENKPALRPVEKVGYRFAGTLGYVQIGPWRRHFGRPDRQDQGQAHWDGVARQGQDRQHYLDPFLGERKRRAHLDLIARWGGASPGGRLLKTDLFEEAMGPDAFLTDLGGKLVGMDISPVIAGQARQRDAGQRAAYVAADVRRPPFADGAFDLVVSPSTLDHFEDPADLGRSLRELGRILAPSGRLIVTLDNRQNIFDPLLRLVIRLGLVPYYIGCAYTVDEVHAELEAAGLAVQDTTAILHNPRLVATGTVGLANRVGWPPLINLVRRMLTAAERLEGTRWRYRTGSFVAALAARQQGQEAHCDPSEDG